MTPPPDLAAEIEAWRRRRIDRLVSEDGWLSLTGLYWLSEGENAVGTDRSSAVLLPGAAPARAGSIRRDGNRVVFAPSPEAVAFAEAEGRPVRRPLVLRSDGQGVPTILSFGPIRFHLVERGSRLGIRVADRDNPARRRLPPIPAFPVSAAWRFDARFERYDPPRRFPFPSILGTVEEEVSPGAVLFSVGARELRLEPILERGETDYWVVFGDRTNGAETYAGGRFVYVAPPVAGRTILDFNKAYNPPCVFTPHSTCPLPPPQNRLPIRVEAGEKLPAP